jgi:hypothetical protein
MAKQAGLGDRLWVAGRNLSGDIGSLGAIGGGPSPLDMTAIDKSAFERDGGLRDGRFEFSSFFNKAAGAAHLTLSTLPTADVRLIYGRGSTLGGQAAGIIGKQVNYDPSRGQDGSLTIAVQVMGNGSAIEWGNYLTAGERTDSGAANGTGVDFGGSTAFGLQAYLQVTAFTGTSVTVKLQESQNDGGADPYADVTGGAFTAVSAAPASQRIITSGAQTVERWLRVVTTGTFSSATFVVIVCKNTVATVF